MSVQYDEMAEVTPEMWGYLLGRVMIQSTLPRIIANRENYRLVHQVRPESHWQNISDLTLERFTHDAMGEGRWDYVASWCLSVRREPLKSEDDKMVLALKLILDPGPVVDTSPRP